MEFSKEIAVLQSAFQLANQLCSGGLQQFHKTQHPRSLQVLEDGIIEICEGLEHDLTPAEHTRWQHRLAALCTYLVQRHLGINTEASDGQFETVTSGIPAINAALYFELVKRHEWAAHVFVLFDDFPLTAVIGILTSLLEHIAMETHSRDLDLLLQLQEFISLHRNHLIHIHDDHLTLDPQSDKSAIWWEVFTKVIDLTSNIRRLCEKVGTNKADTLVNGAQVLLQLCGLFHALSKKSAHVLKKSTLTLENIVTVSECEHVTACKESASSIQKVGKQGEYILPTPDGKIAVMDSPFARVDFKPCSPAIVTHLAENIRHLDWVVTELFSQPFPAEDFMDSLWDSAAISTNACGVPSQILGEEMELQFVAFFEHLNSKDLDADVEGLPLIQSLRPLYEVLKGRVVKVRQEAESIDRRLKAAVLMTQQHRDSHLEWCDWLLQQEDKSIWHDPRYVQCFEVNPESFSSDTHDLANRAVSRLHQISVDGGPTSTTATTVLVKVFDKLTTVQQLDILSRALGTDTWTYTDSASEEFQQNMTTVFNRLVNSVQEEMEKLLRQVACLAIQQPTVVLCKLVETAVRSGAQTQLLAQILQELQPLASLRREQSQQPIICEHLQKVLTGNPLSRQEIQNIRSFVGTILLPFRSQQLQRETGAVLDVRDFIPACVLSSLRSPADHHSCISMETTLGLLMVAMETTKSLKPDWSMVKDCHMLPMLLCMCHVIEDCRDLDLCHSGQGQGHDKVNWVSVKELAASVLQCVVEVLKSVLESESLQGSVEVQKAMQWLRSKLHQGFHWTTPLYISELFEKLASDNFPLVFAEEVKPFLRPLPGKNIAYRETGTDGYQCVFELCRVSSHMCQLVTESLEPSVFTKDQHGYPRILLALTRVLPVCTSEEWLRIAHVLQWLVEHGALQLPTTDCPPVLYVPTLLYQCLQLMLTSSEHSGDMVQWLHLANCYVTTVKTACGPLLANTEDAASFDSVTELLCQMCLCLHSLPEGSTEPIYVMTLDLLSLLVNRLTNQNAAKYRVARIGSALELVENSSQKDTLDKKFQELVCAR